MNDTVHLTWYRGTILPYSSLWHTLRRVIFLNRLRIGDLRQLVPAISAKQHQITNLLHNSGDAINTEALARLLGEAPAALDWSHMGFAAPWMRFLFTPGMRICPACLAEGYHSALLSLRLLDVCPIHRLPLRSQCNCGRRFGVQLKTQDCLSADSCPCGGFVFFTAQTCRRPTLSPSATTALEPVVRWLQQCSHLAMLRHSEQAQQHDDNATWLRSISVWGNALNIEYPACFLQPPVQQLYTATTFKGSAAVQSAHHSLRTDRPPSSAPDALPLQTIYRAMARHLRRHVVGRSEGWVARFMRSDNALEVARMLAGQPRAVLSLAELMWARQIEDSVEIRRWPYRPKLLGKSMWTLLHNQQLRFDQATQGGSVYLQFDEAQRHWATGCAAAWMLSTLWRHALSRAVMAAQTGAAAWGHNYCSISTLCAGAATLDSNGCVQFVGIAAAGTQMQVPPRPDKLQRRHMATQARDTVLSACKGPCLTWSEQKGWFVAPSYQPAHGEFKRHRLLGIAEARPHFWLFPSSDGTAVARHCGMAIQALGNTPSQAIETLRTAVRSHIKVYGSAGHEPRLKAMSVTPQPAEVLGSQRLREEPLHTQEKRSFWTGSSWLATMFLLNEAGRNVSPAHQRDQTPMPAWAEEFLRQYRAG